ncbi:MAG: hypothetical protein IV090_00335 [Candidatus Sericytochromatia bacterium]|nr:hypothetical protein [Candidatus Sericytochromatia bacterium]
MFYAIYIASKKSSRENTWENSIYDQNSLTHSLTHKRKRSLILRFSSVLSLMGMLTLQACTPPANQVKPAPTASPILLENVPNLLSPTTSKKDNLHFGLGDFKVQALILCGWTTEEAQASYGGANSCYSAGGSPLWNTITSGSMVGPDGYCHTYAGCEWSTGDDGGGGNDNDNNNGSCPEGTPAIFDPATQTIICGASCPPGTVPTASGSGDGTELCEPVADEPCEDAQALFPAQLASPLNAAQNLVQPINDPAPMNQDLGDWQKLMKKLKDRQAKMAAEQEKPKPNQNKINNWQAEANATVDQLDVLNPRIQNRVSQMDSARPALRSELNSVAQQPDFSQDAHADQQVNPLPQTLEEYRTAIASLVDEFDLRVSSENTYDLMAASSSLADEQELYGHLVRDILSEKLPLTPEEPDEDPTDEPLEQINTPRKLVRWLGKRMVNQATKLQNKQQQLNQKVSQDAEILKQDVLEAQELIQQVILMTLHDAKMVDLRDLSVHLPSGGFSTQGCFGSYDQPLICDVMDPAFIPNATSFGEMVSTIVEHYGSVANFIKNVQRPYMEEVAKRVSGYSDAQWQNLKNADPNAALDLVNAFMEVAAPLTPQDPIDFVPFGKQISKGAQLTLATGVILSKRSEGLLKSLVKKYAAKGDEKSQQIVKRAKNLLKRNEARVQKLKDACQKCPGLKWNNLKSLPTWGHTFLHHGQKVKLSSLIDEARSKGPQGQWLDDQAAAKFLEQLRPSLQAGGKQIAKPLPPELLGKARVIKSDGTMVNATHFIPVPSPKGGYTSAYPVLKPN